MQYPESMAAIPLTEQQQRALDAAGANPPQVVDPRNNAAYVLVPATEYQEVREIVADEKRQQTIRGIAFRNAGYVIESDCEPV